MRRFTIIAFNLIFFCLFANAVPAKPGILTHIQPDGSTIEFYLHGDEFFNFATTPDGYLITRTSDEYFEYAEMTNFKVNSLGIRVNNPTSRTQDEIALLKQTHKFSLSDQEFTTARNIRMKARNNITTNKAPAIGERGLVILVNFSDKSFITPNPNQAFHNLLNQKGYNKNSALGSSKDYFYAQSMGTFDPVFDVFGPYTLDNNMAYYGGNSSGDDIRPAQMVVDAVTKMMEDDSANANLANYDTDNDGYVDNVFIFYAGYNEAEGGPASSVWPHKWNASYGSPNGEMTYNNKTIDVYACTSELKSSYGSTMAGIGTFTHEFTHVLGLPDLYITNYGSYHKTSGKWDIMDQGPYNNNGNTPPAYSAYERFFLGWITPTILNDSCSIRMGDLTQTNCAYLISETGEHNLDGKNPIPSTFYLLENRVKRVNSYDLHLPGEGMIITKIDYDEYSWEYNMVNNDKYDMGVDIIEADEIDHYGIIGKEGDAFPGSAKVKNFSPYSNYPITNIQFINDAISFEFMGGGVSVDNIRHIESNDLMLINNNRISGLSMGDNIRCIDINGRIIWNKYATDTEVPFSAPKGLYCIIIERNGQIFTLKGVN